jgi:hypothetical protein
MSYFASARRYEALCAEPSPRPPRPAPRPPRRPPGPPRRDGQAELARVAGLLGTTPGELRRRDRTAAASQRRHEAMYLLARAGVAQAEIARLLDRDGSSVRHGLRRIAARQGGGQ